MNSFIKVLSSLFLVTGTCVGGGMLALPVKTGINGLIPSFLIMVACCFVMTLTALLYLEVIVKVKSEAHVIGLTSRLLNSKYKVFVWLLYLFMSYASLVAYASGGGPLTAKFFASVFDIKLSYEWSCVLFIIFFGVISCLGEKIVGRMNAILVTAMIGAYIFLTGSGFSEIKTDLLLFQNYDKLFYTVPVLLTIFSFQAFIVPGICSYLEYDVKKLKVAIIGGSVLTLIIYSVWQLLVLGTVPVEGAMGLASALEKGHPATEYLQNALTNPLTIKISLFFSFFALTTSFLGMTMGLSEFLADGMKISRKGWALLMIMVIIIVPTLFFATKFERIFIMAMDTTGGLGDTIINGLLPISFVWSLRYKIKKKSEYTVFGGKPLLVMLFIVYLLFFIQELLIQAGLIY